MTYKDEGSYGSSPPHSVAISKFHQTTIKRRLVLLLSPNLNAPASSKWYKVAKTHRMP